MAKKTKHLEVSAWSRPRQAALLIGCIVAPLIIGWIGSIATIPAIPGWYAGLEKPFFNPPNQVFGPVWTLLYALMGASYFLFLRAGKAIKTGSIIFAIQLTLNLFWSLIFFGLHLVWLAFIDILLLIIAVSLTIDIFRQTSKHAAWLLAPYLAWVCFASALNGAILWLNS